jgi:hypothetical protein
MADHADVATVGASATELRHSLAISNTDLGLLVTVTSLVAAVTTLPFGPGRPGAGPARDLLRRAGLEPERD